MVTYKCSYQIPYDHDQTRDLYTLDLTPYLRGHCDGLKCVRLMAKNGLTNIDFSTVSLVNSNAIMHATDGNVLAGIRMEALIDVNWWMSRKFDALDILPLLYDNYSCVSLDFFTSERPRTKTLWVQLELYKHNK